MKKLLALAGIALIAAACTNNDEPVQECGQINLTLENSTAPEIEVSTRTVTDLTETDAKDYKHTSPPKRQCKIGVNQLSDL